MEKLKNIIKLAVGLLISTVSMCFVPQNLLLLIPLYFGFQMSLNGLTQNFIKNNSFLVNRNKKKKFKGDDITVDMINQNPSNLVRFVRHLFKRDKSNNFYNELFNVFKQLPQTRNGKLVKYGCVSHAKTYKALQELNSKGYIQNLQFEKRKRKSRLIIEELMMGNRPALKKRIMFNIYFELTDKKISKEDFDRLVIVDKTKEEVKEKSVDQTVKNVSNSSVGEYNSNETVEKKEAIKVADEEVERLQKLVREIPSDVELDEETIKKLLDSNEINDDEIKNTKSR